MIYRRISDHGIISLLVEEELSAMSQLRIRFAIFINVRRRCEGARHTIQIYDRALADIEENAYITLTSAWEINY